MKTRIASVKGTRDFYPEEMARRTWLYQMIREISTQYGYQEYEAPILERIDLYAAKSGEELVKEQAFVFPDRGGELITLRPELTPSLARMVAQRQNELVYPLRWWSFGPFWRYERPQKGRTREFFQWNIDMIGAYSPEADAELVAICARLFQKAGLTAKQVKICVNDRRLMDAELVVLGIAAGDKKNLFRVLDRRDKLSPTEWDNYALSTGIPSSQLIGIKRLMEDKALWKKSGDLKRFFLAVAKYGVADYVEYNPEVIRGLDYYTGTVFEAFDVEGGRAILGGGRYDNLLADVGGEPLGGVGFAMGDVVVSLVLEKYGLLPDLRQTPDVLVTVFHQELINESVLIAEQLRQAGLAVVSYPEAAKLSKQIKFADRQGIRVAVVMGPDEWERGDVAIKDLKGQTQETIPVTDLIHVVKRKLAAPSTV